MVLMEVLQEDKLRLHQKKISHGLLMLASLLRISSLFVSIAMSKAMARVNVHNLLKVYLIWP
jgi:hypothetical protein